MKLKWKLAFRRSEDLRWALESSSSILLPSLCALEVPARLDDVDPWSCAIEMLKGATRLQPQPYCGTVSAADTLPTVACNADGIQRYE